MKAWKHQEEGVQFAKKNRGTLLHWDMGSGKTIGTILLAEEIGAKNILIISPKAVIPVWAKEFEKFIPGKYMVSTFTKGTVKVKSEKLKKFISLHPKRGKVAVFNYEACWRPGLGFTRNKRKIIIDRGALCGIQWDMIVLDEAHKICASTSKVSEFCSHLRESGKKLLALTGTPLTNGPLSAHGIFNFLAPEIFGTPAVNSRGKKYLSKSYYRFKMRYAMFGGFQGYQIIEYINQEEFKEKFGSITHQVKVDDVIELPDVVHEYVSCELSPSARKLYNEFKDECVVDFKNSELTAENVLVKTLRLAQIASGSVNDDDGKTHVVDSAKVDMAKEIIEGLPPNEAVVVFGRFTSEIERLREDLEKTKKDIFTCSELTGRRNELASWQDGDSRVLLVNIQAGSAGVDFTRSRYCIYLSTGYSYVNYQQSLARLRRPGSDLSHKIMYYHVNATDTIDEKVAVSLNNKRNVIDAILLDLK